jgi:hypothetical protein
VAGGAAAQPGDHVPEEEQQGARRLAGHPEHAGQGLGGEGQRDADQAAEELAGGRRIAVRPMRLGVRNAQRRGQHRQAVAGLGGQQDAGQVQGVEAGPAGEGLRRVAPADRQVEGAAMRDQHRLGAEVGQLGHPLLRRRRPPDVALPQPGEPLHRQRDRLAGIDQQAHRGGLLQRGVVAQRADLQRTVGLG